MQIGKTLIAAGIVLSSFSAHAVTPEIAGIRLGSKAGDTKSAITRAEASMVQKDIKDAQGKLLGIEGVLWSGSGMTATAADHIAAAFDESGEVWFVARAQMFETGKRTSVNTLMGALKDKFGPPSSVIDNGLIEWQFDRAGKLYTGPSSSGPCNPNGEAGTSLYGGISAPNINIPARFTAACGVRIVADFVRLGDGMVSQYTVRAYDSARMYDAAKRKADAKDQAARKQLDAEKAANVKPKL